MNQLKVASKRQQTYISWMFLCLNSIYWNSPLAFWSETAAIILPHAVLGEKTKQKKQIKLVIADAYGV